MWKAGLTLRAAEIRYFGFVPLIKLIEKAIIIFVCHWSGALPGFVLHTFMA